MARHIELRVTAVRPAGPEIVGVTLMDPDGWPLPAVRAGAHLDLQVPAVGARAYSLCGDPADQCRWTIAVKRDPASRGGSRFVHQLRPGDTVWAGMPRATFPLAEGARRHLMLAGGIGVTPFLAMAPVLARAGAAWTLHLLYRRAPPCAEALAPWIAAGRVVLHDTAAGRRPALAALLGAHLAGTHAYCCGPPAMLEAFWQATAAWPEGAARAEHFVPPARPPDPDAQAYTLVLAASGAAVEVPAGGSMVQALRSLGAVVSTTCEGGICGACKVGWLQGEPVHRDLVLSPAERRTHLMACVAGCRSARLVVDA